MKSKQKVVVLGASANMSRYSYKAVRKLHENGYEVYPVGLREGFIEGKPILTSPPLLDGVYAIVLYMCAENQKAYYDYIISTKPGYVHFNPGTWNAELIALANKNGIRTEEGCTLAALSMGDF